MCVYSAQTVAEVHQEDVKEEEETKPEEEANIEELPNVKEETVEEVKEEEIEEEIKTEDEKEEEKKKEGRSKCDVLLYKAHFVFLKPVVSMTDLYSTYIVSK